MRSRRAVSEGSRRMISAICEDMLESEFTSSRRAWLMRPNEASLGQALMRLRMTSSEYLAATGGWEVDSMKRKGKAAAPGSLAVAVSCLAQKQRPAGANLKQFPRAVFGVNGPV